MGTIYVVIAALSWGMAGVLFKLFDNIYSVDVVWMNCARIFVSACALLGIGLVTKKGKLFEIFKKPKDMLVMLIYSTAIIGLQITFYYTISISNAGIATMIQYTFPIMVLVYTCIRNMKKPHMMELVATVVAILGIVSIVTHGNPTHLAISMEVFAWGMASALAMALYTVIPQELLKKYPEISVTSTAMLVAAAESTIAFRPISNMPHNADATMLLCVIGIALLSSVVPFVAFNKGVKRVGAVKASIICTLEPFTSTVLTFLTGVKITAWDVVGLLAIMTAVILIAYGKK